MTTNPLFQVPRELASDWVYKVHAWRGRSPEFMQTQVSRLEAVIREAMHIALSHIIAELHEYADTDMPTDRLIGIDAAIERIRAAASSLTERETTK